MQHALTSPTPVYTGPVWDMPSDSTPGLYYRVSIDPRTQLYVCECPDHQTRLRDCKHICRVQRLLADKSPYRRWG